MILSFWWEGRQMVFFTRDSQPGHLSPAVVLTPGPKFSSYWPSHLLITIHVLHGFFSISKRSITADTSVPRERPLPITRYPHDRMPNYIAYFELGQGDPAKYSRIQPRGLDQVLSESAKVTRPKYSRSRPKFTRPKYSRSRPKFTRPKYSRSRPKFTRPCHSDSVMVIRPR